MRYRYASNSNRFLTYFIDFLIIEVIYTAISAIVYKVINFNIDMNDNLLEKMMEELLVVLETGYLTDYFNYYTEFMKYSLVEIGVQTASALVAMIGYLVVLPHFWKKQTVGRLLFKTKVLMMDESEPTTKAIIIRELVGSFLLYYCCGLIPIIITWVFVNKYQRSLVDKISGTKLVLDVEFETPKGEKPINDDYIDAKFVEIEKQEGYTEEPKNDKEPEPDEDGYIVF